MRLLRKSKHVKVFLRSFLFSRFETFLFYCREYLAVLLLFISVICILLGLNILREYIPSKTLTVTFVDVGQGDAIYIESPARTKVFIDGGPSRKALTFIDSELPFFDRKIDVVLPTHADADHIVGIIHALDAFSVDRTSLIHASSSTELDDMYSSRIQSKEVIDLVAGDSIDIGGGAHLQVLLPFAEERFSDKETNESSQVLLLTYNDFSFLLTGDLPLERERYLIESGLLPERLSVLKLGHHGSKGSSGVALLQKTKPWYIVVSAGKDNRYGHPHKETLERVKKVGSVIVRTDEMGSITFRVRGEKMEMSSDRK